MRLALAAAALLLAATPAGAEYLEFGDAVPGHAGVTVFDLVARIVPDLSAEGAGTAPAIRHLLGPDWNEAPPAVLAVTGADLVPFRAGGDHHLAMLLTLGESDTRIGPTVVLAAFDPVLGLVDVVDVATDRMTYFRTPPSLATGPADDLLMVESSHFNSNQNYASVELIALRSGRLTLVDEIALLSVRDCGLEHSQSLEVTASGADTEPHWPIVATVTDTRSVDPGADCPAPLDPASGFERAVTVTYTWNEAEGAYRPDSDAFAALAEENAARF